MMIIVTSTTKYTVVNYYGRWSVARCEHIGVSFIVKEYSQKTKDYHHKNLYAISPRNLNVV